MLIFVCGGACQGKRSWAAQKWKIPKQRVLDGREAAQCIQAGSRLCQDAEGCLLLDHYEVFVRETAERGGDVVQATDVLLSSCPDLVIITDEIGSGIIPMDKKLQEYRELHGRLCCSLAGKAQEVYRVTCGIGTRIKP